MQPSRCTGQTGTVCAVGATPPARGGTWQHCRQQNCSAAGGGRGHTGWDGACRAQGRATGPLLPDPAPQGSPGSPRAHLALLVPVGEELQAVGGDSQELGVVLVQQGNHLLQAVGQAHSHLGPFLVEQQVVQGGDGVEEDRLDRRAAGRRHRATSALTGLPAGPAGPPRAPTPTRRPSAGPAARPPCHAAPGRPSGKGHLLRAETEPPLHGQGSVGDRSPPPATTMAPNAANPWGFCGLKGLPLPCFGVSRRRTPIQGQHEPSPPLPPARALASPGGTPRLRRPPGTPRQHPRTSAS